jgi:hypothetical protein
MDKFTDANDGVAIATLGEGCSARCDVVNAQSAAMGTRRELAWRRHEQE